MEILDLQVVYKKINYLLYICQIMIVWKFEIDLICWWIVHHFGTWLVLIHNIWSFPSKKLVLNYQYYSYWFWKLLCYEHVELDKKITYNNDIKISKNNLCIHLIDLNWRSMNLNILLPIKEISSNTINYNWSHFFIKTYKHFEPNDGKSLQVRGIWLEWIVVPWMLNVTSPMYAMSNFFL